MTLTELNFFFSKQDFFDLTKEMISYAAGGSCSKKHFKSKKSSLETSGLNGGWLSPLLTHPARHLILSGPRIVIYKRRCL